MTPADPYQQALDAARRLDAAGVGFVVIGSAARALRGEALAKPPGDVDLVLDDAASLERACEVLVREGFALQGWGEPIVLPVGRQAEGKIYVRARRGAEQIDVMFPPLPEGFPDPRPHARRLDGLDVAAG
jgi:hypothetical protein